MYCILIKHFSLAISHSPTLIHTNAKRITQLVLSDNKTQFNSCCFWFQATVIENLDVYGIDAREFAHHVQVKVACSASVNPSPQKNKGPLVTIQGNQTNFVEVLLTSEYTTNSFW